MAPAVLKVCASVANYANYGLKELVAIGRFPRTAVAALCHILVLVCVDLVRQFKQ